MLMIRPILISTAELVRVSDIIRAPHVSIDYCDGTNWEDILPLVGSEWINGGDHTDRTDRNRNSANSEEVAKNAYLHAANRQDLRGL